MQETRLRIVILGLSITSSWGNGHATTYRGLVRGLVRRGHDVLFLERDQPWYAKNRDLPRPPYGRTGLYSGITELKDRFARDIRDADVVIVGSYVPEGVTIGEWVMFTTMGVTAFYDIDTPITLAKLDRGDTEYLSRSLVMQYDLYLSFTGGPILCRLREKYHSPCARVLYCSADPENYYSERVAQIWDMGYLGTYSADRQKTLEDFLLSPARHCQERNFVVAGPMFPADIKWPPNVDRIEHLPPGDHRTFYNSQKFTLNVTRSDMLKAGYSPSVRLFEAAACATPIITDYWHGLEECFAVDKEILVARSTEDSLRYLERTSADERQELGERLRNRVLRQHTGEHRAAQLESYAYEALERTAHSLTPAQAKA
jgi:spore maturation protein CgeB